MLHPQLNTERQNSLGHTRATPPAPLRLVVEPNVLWAKTSSVSGEALHHATAGERALILVHARDACGNSVCPSAQMRFGISLWDRQAKQPVVCGESGLGVMLIGGEGGGETVDELVCSTVEVAG